MKIPDLETEKMQLLMRLRTRLREEGSGCIVITITPQEEGTRRRFELLNLSPEDVRITAARMCIWVADIFQACPRGQDHALYIARAQAAAELLDPPCGQVMQ